MKKCDLPPIPQPREGPVIYPGITPGTTVEIYDITGAMRIREEETDGVIEVSGLPEGVYFLRVWQTASTPHRLEGVWSFVRGRYELSTFGGFARACPPAGGVRGRHAPVH
ncbi:MAG: T9SS type A sorting domain-containing protein [Saprospirales bacterium]|nr:T9SS type A sorting domain-containing protein [Saprospirales bacterium]